jgi:hypothetical protein
MTAAASRALARTGALLAIVLITACVYRGKQVGVTPAGGGVAVGVGATRGWAIKEVVQKNPPSTLMARDGTVCEVSETRYNETRVGAQVQCEWR